MRKAIFLAGMLFLAGGLLFSSGSRIIAKYAQFHPSDQVFKDSYGKSIGYGGEINISVSKFLDVWAAGMYYSKDGILSGKAEEKRLVLVPIECGLKFKIPLKAIATPYFGGGAVRFEYREKSLGEEVKDSGLGYSLQAGLVIPPCSGPSCGSSLFSLDLFVNYSDCRVNLRDIPVNVGGIRLGIGWGFTF